jgi:hypothetical protein
LIKHLICNLENPRESIVLFKMGFTDEDCENDDSDEG